MSNTIKSYLAAKDKDPSARIESPEINLSKASVSALETKPYDYHVRVKGYEGLRVRVRATLKSGRKRAGALQMILVVSVEVEGQAKPAAVAETIGLYFLDGV